jgi:hypothetical protein
MKMIFYRKHRYHLPQPSEQVQNKLRFITTRRYEDYSIDIVGRLEPDGRFELMHKWGITNTELVENRRAYLQGILTENKDGSYLEISLRPNIVFIISFYLTLLLLTLEVFGFNIVPYLSKPVKIIALCGVNLLLLGIIFVSVNSLKKRFESLMQLN